MADLGGEVEIVAKVLEDFAGASPDEEQERNCDDGDEEGGEPVVPDVGSRRVGHGRVADGTVVGRGLPSCGQLFWSHWMGWIWRVGRPKLKAS